MIPKQTPVRNFRPAACRFTLPFPQGLSREGKLCAYRLPLETYGFQTAQRDMMPCIAIICGGKAAPCRLLYCTAASSSVPPFPQDLSQEKNFRTSRPSSPNLPLPKNRTRRKCLVPQSFAAVRCRSRAAGRLALSGKIRAKKEKPVSGLLSGLCLAGFEPATFRVGV